MKQFWAAALLMTYASVTQAQGTLQYFGYANGANDLASLQTNSGFTNVAIYAAEVNTSLVSDVQQMNAYGVKAIILLDYLFFAQCTPKPTCNNKISLCKVLRSNYQTVWADWRSRNAAVLNSTYVAAFYIVDEPAWNNVSNADIGNATDLVHNTYPNIPTMINEASQYCAVNKLQIPYNLQWAGIDQYAILSPYSNASYLSNLSTLKAKMNFTRQKLFYVLDAFWDAGHDAAGISPEDMATVASNWYQYASNDPNAIGLFGFIWTNSPNWTGSCCLPANVRAEHTAIGEAITRK